MLEKARGKIYKKIYRYPFYARMHLSLNSLIVVFDKALNSFALRNLSDLDVLLRK
jgi:hypothetical protein